MKRDQSGRPQDLAAIQPISQGVLKEQDLRSGEPAVEDLYRRVANVLGSVDE